MTLADNEAESREKWLEHRKTCDVCCWEDKDTPIASILRKCIQGWKILTN